jgi:ADP-heptose:LPS heptosyltransferase
MPVSPRAGALPHRIAIFRALQLGDMLCAVPALRAVRAALPNSRIELIGLPWAHILLERFPEYLNGFHEFPGWPGLPERTPQFERIPAFLRQMQAEQFDLVLQLHGSGGLSNPLVALFGGRRTAGFYTPGSYRPDAELFLPFPEEGLEIRRLLKLPEFLDMPARGEYLEFPLHRSDRQALARLPGAASLEPGRYVCLHPGASVAARRWPVERFAALAQQLAPRGLQIVLTGTASEADLTRQLAQDAGAACLDFAGQTELGVLAALLSGARLLVANDTGVSHLASVVISTGANPARWAPIDTRRHRVLCDARGVRPRAVLEAIDNLLHDYPTSSAVAEPVVESGPVEQSCCAGSKG